jgi:response regulator RpfG family c-di-GMP phosphodiesterase
MSEVTKAPMTVLCVDDESNILKSLQRLLQDPSYQLLLANSGEEALTLLANNQVDLVLSDMRMPGINGAELMEQVATKYPMTYRIILTGYADMSSAVAAVNLGKINRYMQKPWNNDELKTLVRDGLEQTRLQRQNRLLTQQLAMANKQLRTINQQLEEKVNQRTEQLRQTLLQLRQEQNATMNVLFQMTCQDPHISAGFAKNVSDLATQLAQKLALSKSEIETIGLAAQLSELGLTGVPVEIYAQPFHKMAAADKKAYLNHPVIARDLLAPAKHLKSVSDIIYHQYEEYKGSGTPGHLMANNIPIGARILAVARDYWGYLFKRLSKEKLQPGDVLSLMKKQIRILYCPDVLRALQKIVIYDHVVFTSSKNPTVLKDLRPGMVLGLPLYDEAQNLVLSAGHQLTANSVNQLHSMARDSKNPLRVFAWSPEQLATKEWLTQAELDKFMQLDPE